MVNYKIEENKKEGILTVKVSVPQVRRWHECTTKDVENYLRNEKKDFGKLIKKDYVSNRHDKNSGEWIFEKPAKKKLDKPAKPMVSSKRANKAKEPSSA